MRLVNEIKIDILYMPLVKMFVSFPVLFKFFVDDLEALK